MKEKIVTLDVREDIHNGREPFSRIMQSVSRLRRNEKLRLIAPFQPTPLLEILASQGFLHRVTPRAGGDWEVLFSRTSEAKPGNDPSSSQLPERPKCSFACGRMIRELDARGLKSGQPLAAIMDALHELDDKIELKAHTDNRPMHLYAHLDNRGFVGRTEEQSDGSYITYIHRPDSSKSTRN